MNRQQRMQNRATAQALADEVFEANLPDGLYLNAKRELYFYCRSCERRTIFDGTADEFRQWEDYYHLCGGSDRCIP